jgi:glycosyltransferase 2 family protein
MWRRLTQVLVLSIVFAVAGFAVVFLRGGLKFEQLGAIRQLSPLFLFLALLTLFASFVLAGLRLRHLCSRLSLRLKFRHALRAHILGIFSATVTPGGSGATPAVALMLQYQGLTSGQAWATSLAVFVADAIFHVWSLPLAIILFLRWHGLYPQGVVWTIAGILAIVITALIAYILLFRLRWLGPLFRWLFRGALLRFRKRALRFVASLLESNHYFTGASWGFYGLTQLYTALSWFCFFCVLTFLAKGLQLHISALASAAWQIATTTVSYFVPTPGGSGFFELGTSFLLLGRGNDNAVPAVLLAWRILTFYSFFVLGPLLGGYVLVKRLQEPTGNGDPSK